MPAAGQQARNVVRSATLNLARNSSNRSSGSRRCIASSSKAPQPEVQTRSPAKPLNSRLAPPVTVTNAQIQQSKAAEEQEKSASPAPLPSSMLPPQAHPPTHGVHVCTLHLRSYGTETFSLEFFTDFARRAAFELGIPCGGVARLPTRTALWTVPRSPFVHKKSQENFERRTHKRAIKLWDASDEVVDRWLHFLRIHSMAGVGMKAQVFRYQPPGIGAKILEGSRELRRNRGKDAGPSGATTTAEPSKAAQTLNSSPEAAVKALADGIIEEETAKEHAELAMQQEQEAESSATHAADASADKSAEATALGSSDGEQDISAMKGAGQAKSKAGSAPLAPSSEASSSSSRPTDFSAARKGQTESHEDASASLLAQATESAEAASDSDASLKTEQSTKVDAIAPASIEKGDAVKADREGAAPSVTECSVDTVPSQSDINESAPSKGPDTSKKS